MHKGRRIYGWQTGILCPLGAACLMGTQKAARTQEMEVRSALRGGCHLGNNFNNNGATNHLRGFSFDVGAGFKM